jgi:hypothetical protein
MSSLWTPGGEHKVPRAGEPPAPPGDAGDAPPPRRPPSPPPGDEGEIDEETAEELRELTRQLAAAPPEDVVANHCYGMFELAALHLSQQPPNLVAARLPIDAMALLVEGLGERLGGHRESLVEGLNQLRLAYVRIADVAHPPDAAAPADATAPPDAAAPPDSAATPADEIADEEGGG